MISMVTPTFKNIDHSSRAVVEAVTNTYHGTTGSTENVERLLESIYKELCAKNAKINISVPEQESPIVNIAQPEIPIVNNVEIRQEPQKITVTVEYPKTLIYINLGMALLTVISMILMVLKK